MIILDEHGDRWLVLKGDPLAPALASLIRLGFREESLVVPLMTLLGGRLVLPKAPDPPWEGEDFLRWCRQWETCDALKNLL
jgi:hypothetical protein